jgi:hypothetical protein
MNEAFKIKSAFHPQHTFRLLLLEPLPQPELRSAVATALIDSWMPSLIRGSVSPARWRFSSSIWSRLSGSI